MQANVSSWGVLGLARMYICLMAQPVAKGCSSNFKVLFGQADLHLPAQATPSALLHHTCFPLNDVVQRFAMLHIFRNQNCVSNV